VEAEGGEGVTAPREGTPEQQADEVTRLRGALHAVRIAYWEMANSDRERAQRMHDIATKALD
jgi:hypothetical protein